VTQFDAYVAALGYHLICVEEYGKVRSWLSPKPSSP
jgi:hypothetical protein